MRDSGMSDSQFIKFQRLMTRKEKSFSEEFEKLNRPKIKAKENKTLLCKIKSLFGFK
jgi:hypothetical protein